MLLICRFTNSLVQFGSETMPSYITLSPKHGRLTTVLQSYTFSRITKWPPKKEINYETFKTEVLRQAVIFGAKQNSHVCIRHLKQCDCDLLRKFPTQSYAQWKTYFRFVVVVLHTFSCRIICFTLTTGPFNTDENTDNVTPWSLYGGGGCMLISLKIMYFNINYFIFTTGPPWKSPL